MALYGGVTLPGKPDLENVLKLDQLPMPAIREMMKTGMAIDRDWFSDLSSQLGTEIKELRSQICSYVPQDKLEEFTARAIQAEEDNDALDDDDPDKDQSQTLTDFNVGSTQQLSKLLFDVLGIGAGHSLKLTKSGSQISTGKKQLEKFKRDHPIVPLVLEYKEKSKIKNTYSDKLPLLARLHTATSCWCGERHWYDSHRIHTDILTTRTTTGRLACVAKWTPVNVQGGTKRIDEIKVGDLVWTHQGRWRPVTATWIKGYEQMYHVIFRSGQVLTCTGAHRLLVSSNEHFKKLDAKHKEHSGSIDTLPIKGMLDSGADSGKVGNYLSQCDGNMQKEHVYCGVQGAIGNTVLTLQNCGKESNVRQDRRSAPQLDRAGRRWVRVSDLLEGWQEAVHTSNCDGRSTGPEGAAGNIRRTSYRRGHEEQRSGQSVIGYKSWASENSLPSSQGYGVDCIEEIHPAGSLEVYDISVDEDESYSACGVFSHNSKNPNLQNIPARTELGRRTRAGFIPSPGMEMFAVDFGQFEMRLGAHYSMDENLMRIFWNNLDPHSDTAMRAFHKTLLEVEQEPGKMLYRAPCKNVNFGIFYGLTAEGLYDLMLLTYATAGLDIPDWLILEWCDQFIDDWFGLYPRVRQYMDNQFYRAKRYNIAWTLLGRIRRIPEVRSVHARIAAGGERQAGNSPIQGTQADLNKIAIAEVYDTVIKRARREGIAAKLLITVHDEIVGECEQGYGEMLTCMCEDVMSRVMVDRETGVDMCAVPIKADGHVMQRWMK